MKIKSFLIIVPFFFIIFSVGAQKLKFHSINTIGLSDGQGGAHFLMQTVNGLAYEKWYAGIGFGADYYHYKSYPLFIDARRYFGRNNQGFGYGDLGYNLNAANKPGQEVSYYTSYHFTSGMYTDIGLGYKIKLSRTAAFLISGGYSYKEIYDKASIVEECFVAPCYVDYSKYKYGNGRVVLKAGVDF